MLKPSDDPRGRAAVLTLWSLGALVLHEHANRLLGADLLGDPFEAFPYYLPGLEIMGAGLMTPEVHERMREQFRQMKEQQS